MAPSRPEPALISVWDLPALKAAFAEHSIKQQHATAVLSALLRNPQADLQALPVPNLPKAASALLAARFTACSSRVLRCQRSAGADTTKLLIELHDGLQVEAVIMHYDTADRYAGKQEAAGWGNKRGTLCVSSQVGCQMGCTFCATGTMGLKGQLSCGEIVEQLVHAVRVTPIRNCVFMGMGEPLANYEAVYAAVGMMADSRLFGISRRHVTVSTVGVIPRIRSLAADLPGVSLALSLHAPNQELRRRIVPSARGYPLPKLLAAVEEYQAQSGQRVFVEYVVLQGVNDALQQAHELGELLRGRDVLLNLIPWNPVYQPEGPFFEAPPPGRVAEFQAAVRGYGVHCTVRQEKGQDIAGACGQLVVQHSQEKADCGGGGCGGGGAAVDVEDLGAGLAR